MNPTPSTAPEAPEAPELKPCQLRDALEKAKAMMSKARLDLFHHIQLAHYNSTGKNIVTGDQGEIPNPPLTVTADGIRESEMIESLLSEGVKYIGELLNRPAPPAVGWLQAASEEIAELSQKGVLTAQAVKQLLAVHCCVPVEGWMDAALWEIFCWNRDRAHMHRGPAIPEWLKILKAHAPDVAKLEAEVARMKEDAEQWAQVAMQKQREASAANADNERLRKACDGLIRLIDSFGLQESFSSFDRARWEAAQAELKQ